MNLKRQNVWLDDIEDIVNVAQEEMAFVGGYLGYRSLSRRLLSQHGFRVPRNVVSNLQQLLDPDGVNGRRSGRLTRRVYNSKGPNYLVHVDGYDKLKKYGFAIHGAICGFSRRILWLQVGRTNNDPRIIAYHFMGYINKIKGVPCILRVDAGTENTIIIDIQKSFRYSVLHNEFPEEGVLIGSSHHNQRIERWWLDARKKGVQFWIDLFRQMENDGIFSTSNSLHIECLRLCFTDIIQRELTNIRKDWNDHMVRKTKNSNCPNGKPNMLYFAPEIYDTYDYKCIVNQEDIDRITDEFTTKPLRNGCQMDFQQLCQDFISDEGKAFPTSYIEAINLFQYLKNRLCD